MIVGFDGFGPITHRKSIAQSEGSGRRSDLPLLLDGGRCYAETDLAETASMSGTAAVWLCGGIDGARDAVGSFVKARAMGVEDHAGQSTVDAVVRFGTFGDAGASSVQAEATEVALGGSVAVVSPYA